MQPTWCVAAAKPDIQDLVEKKEGEGGRKQNQIADKWKSVDFLPREKKKKKRTLKIRSAM